jgi:predicted transposase/invertase (TIGR01784 family)
MELEILPPTSDFVFKMLFGDERSKSYLMAFLKAFLELPDEEYELIFLDTHIKPEFGGDKLGILDVKVRTASGKVIDIEIQVNPVIDIGKRLSFYKSKLIVEQIGERDPYTVIQQVICICITDYELFPGTAEHWNTFRFYNPKNGLYFKEIPEEIHTLELTKVPVESDGSAGWEWLQFLRSKRKEEFEMVAAKNPEIRKAVNTLYGISADALARAEYEAHLKAQRDWISGIEGGRLQGIQEGIQQGIQQGIQRGIQEGKIETARKLRSMGLSIDQIAQATGLSQEDIGKL